MNFLVCEAIADFRQSEGYREFPLQVRSYFESIAKWLPAREASLPLAAIDAGFAKRLRDRAGRERGYRFGNHTLLLIQVLVKRAVRAGAPLKDRVRNVPRLAPGTPLHHRLRRRTTLRQDARDRTHNPNGGPNALQQRTYIAGDNRQP
ncbi:hypothetical protein [Bradyrhizobium guangzhouense]|uniref:hypothetical protein n=1 Tax=Bradyrhizobium guangzhouense TaxID=1325095 RepID=UPI001009D492|nr:hypothetical protein [Bradyrhizobium guangzhouense]